jgi:UrcA family protein
VTTIHLVEDPMEANLTVDTRTERAATTGRSILVLVVATLLVLLAAHLSPTEYVAGPARQTVVYDYADVTNPARVPAVYQRFEAVAADLCEQAAGGLDLRWQVDCVERLVALAVRDIDAPALTAWHETRQTTTEATRLASAL